ncbi:MAG: DUF4115 domain-containing protein [Gammaproteobacteria bacterium]|nr:MAG: DUF4115 domain-containing protein [Gammaproteobacteria bacterium]
MKPRPCSNGNASRVDIRENVSEEDHTQQTGFAAVGAILAKAREQQQRTVESVASDLHLRSDVVRAIENGDEAQLPALTFVRGYIKVYARLLTLDEAPLIARLPVAVVHSPEPLKRVGMRRPGVSLPAGKWIVWILAVAALVFLVVYGAPVLERLWTSTGSTEVQPNQLQLPLEEQTENNESALLALPETQPLVEQETPPPAEQDIVETFAPESSVQSPAGQETAEEPIKVESVVQESLGPALVQMRFSEDSWVEMEAHGRKLVVGTQYAGSERTVRAKPPIQILLGNAPGVELLYRGEVVDITPFQRGKVAHLTLED